MPRGIFLIFLAVGVAIAGGSSFYYAMAWSWVLEARAWPTARGTITSIDVEDHASGEDGHGTTYYPRLAYSYRVGNRDLSGDRIWLTGNQFYQHREDAIAFVRGYAIGQSVSVLYDPQDPDDAALLNEAPPWQILLFTAVGLVWMALSLGFRLMGSGPMKRRFGRCRKCGARLPVDEYPIYRTEPAVGGGAPARTPDGTAVAVAPAPAPEGRPCPRCGQVEPLNSWRNKPVSIIFLVVFVGIWAIGLYLMFA